MPRPHNTPAATPPPMGRFGIGLRAISPATRLVRIQQAVPLTVDRSGYRHRVRARRRRYR